MLIDARTLDEGATLQADVCIAGAGAAGISRTQAEICALTLLDR